MHGAKGAAHGHKAWKRARMPDGSIRNVRVRRNVSYALTDVEQTTNK
jgi:hypothetical protein